MRDINILTEDYIQLETILAENERKINSELSALRFQIDETIEKYSNSNRDSAAYLELRYSPIFEQLTNVKYRSGLSNLCKHLYENNKVSLDEAFAMSFIFKEEEAKPNSNNISDGVYCFGNLTESEIPESTTGVYSVIYSSTGRNNAVKYIANLQESVVNAYNNLKSIEPAVIHNSLYNLANAYILVKGK